MIEAMASGKTVIASDIPGPRDVISNGYDGFLFESKNVTQLKELLEMSLSDDKLRIKIGNNALKTIAASYTFQIIAEKYLALFDTLTK
jgi:glycosyltransferase involved in cell wall biosynthesis